MIEVEKQPSENQPLAFEFAGKLPTGTSLASGTVSAVRLDAGTTDNSVLASTTLTISGTQARFRVQAGTGGLAYKITALVTLSDGSVLEEDLLLNVVGR